jgi:hypothetical protein
MMRVISGLALILGLQGLATPARAADPERFGIAAFALPNNPAGTIRFEEQRDIVAVEVTFEGAAPADIGLSYLQDSWPRVKLERSRDLTQPCQFGWTPVDDWFNGHWKRAKTRKPAVSGDRVRIEFAPLTEEFSEEVDYDVAFRRTSALRVEGVDPKTVKSFQVWTNSPLAHSTLQVELDAGSKTPGTTVALDGYNAHVTQIQPIHGCRRDGASVRREENFTPAFAIVVEHMTPAHRYSNDDGHVTFSLGDDAFTISLSSLKEQGPIWFADKGVFIKADGDATSFASYAARSARQKTVAQRVMSMPEQSYACAFLGQPRPHVAAWSLGFKQARQRFWLDPNGDLTLESLTVRQLPAADTKRYANNGHGRFFFGLERWMTLARHPDPAPALTYNLQARAGDIEVEQTSLAVPLDGKVLDGPIVGERDLVALVRFRFRNVGPAKQVARLHVDYSSNSGRTYSQYPVIPNPKAVGDWLVPLSARESLACDDALLRGDWNGNGRPVVRARVETPMNGRRDGKGLAFERELDPGGTCDLLLKVPFVNLESADELAALRALEFESSRRLTAEFWRRENDRGARVETPVPQLNELHKAHLSYVQISDPAMPGEPALVNTSVGTSTYSNCGNESCMINEELDQRGLADDAARRLEVWVRYQGTEPLLGRFSDSRGVLHGAGGYSFAGSYNQNHGWILWRLAEHYQYTRDRAWFGHVAPAVIAACDWVTRQRQLTMTSQPSSRGWEHGFMPAGGLEDIREFRYWLTSNVMIWRGVDAAAATLEETGHPEAARIRHEADAFGNDLRRGFETMRQHTPLVRLRNGRWVPYYPGQLYRRGRDVGWIRETLEGSLYLVLSGLYDARSSQAQWILDDYQDNRYMSPPYGYAIVDAESDWFDRGGFSIQPNLLAGLLPYLDRDESEVYIWMFFNAWVACYREEINAMVEHPFPVLGYANTAHPKTSDEANAAMWLRYMFVYGPRDGLYLGRAVPRAWLGQASPIGLENAHTRWGRASVRFEPSPAASTIHARVELDLEKQPPRTVIRFRHPQNKPIAGVTINGHEHRAFDAAKEDVDLSGLRGTLDIDVRF